MAIWVWMDEWLFRRHAERFAWWFGLTAAQIHEGWTKLASDPNIEKARIQGRTMVKLWWIGPFNYWVQRRPVLQ